MVRAPFKAALGLTALLAAPLYAQTAPCRPGDTNGDGVVNAADIFYTINYLFAGGPAPVNCAAQDIQRIPLVSQETTAGNSYQKSDILDVTGCRVATFASLPASDTLTVQICEKGTNSDGSKNYEAYNQSLNPNTSGGLRILLPQNQSLDAITGYAAFSFKP